MPDHQRAAPSTKEVVHKPLGGPELSATSRAKRAFCMVARGIDIAMAPCAVASKRRRTGEGPRAMHARMRHELHGGRNAHRRNSSSISE
eukprot:10094258-Lingulodinium_polyedra.AAC.1